MTRYANASPADGTLQNLYWHPYNEGTVVNSSNTLTTNTLQVIGIHYDGSTLTMNRNGTTMSATTTSTANIVNATGTTNFLLGAWVSDVAANSFTNAGVTNFQLSELLFYNGTLAANERQDMEGYLTWKWNLQGSLSNAHPYLATNPGRIPLSQSPSLTSFVPTNLSNCLLWLDAADTASVLLTSSNTVSSWHDKSGNAYVLSQSTGSQQPLWTSNALMDMPGILFAGGATNQRLVSSSVSALNGIPGLTLFAVIRPTWTSGQGGINNPSFFGMRQAGTSTTKINYYIHNNYTAVDAYNGSSVVYHTGSNASTSLAKDWNLLYSATNNNGTNLAYFDGSLTADSKSISFGSGTNLPFSVGGNNNANEEWVGYIFEVIFYPYVLSHANRQLVEGYLANKWGLTLPAYHSYKEKTSYFLVVPPNAVKPVLNYSVNFTPLSIPGCQLWLDATDFKSFALSSSSVITQWVDKSLNRHRGVSTGSPTLVRNALGTLPAVSFNGSTQYFNFGNVNNLGTNQLFLFVVLKFNTTGNGSVLAKSLLGDASGRYSLLRESGTFIPLVSGATAANNNGATSDTTTSFRLVTMVWDRSNVTLYQNGTSISSNSLVDTTNLTNTYPFLLGAYNNASGGVPPHSGLYFNGFICEVLQYLAPLTSNQRQAVESYLSQKWNLKSLLPTNHLTFTAPAGLAPTLTLNRQLQGFRVNLVPVVLSSFTASNLTVSVSWSKLSTASYIVTLFSSSTNSIVGGTQVSRITTTNTTRTFSSLTAGTYYYALVQPTDLDRLGPITPTATAVATQPSAVSTPTLTISAGVASVSWSGSTAASSYTIQLYADGSLSQSTTGVTGTSTSFSNLVGNTNHYVRVIAVNAAGSSTASQSSTVLSTPNPVSTPTFSLSGLSVTVSWSAPTGGATSYTVQLYANGSVSQTTSGVTGTSTSFSSLSGNISYYAAVAAVNATGSSAVTNSATSLTVPSAPTLPTLSLPTPAPNTATVSWTAPTGGAASYTVQLYQNGGVYATNSGIGGTSTTFASVPGNANYFAIVTAVNATGSSSGAQTGTIGYALLPSPVEAGGIIVYPYSSTNTMGASIYNTPANNATNYFTRLFTSATEVSSGGTVIANLSGAQWSGGGAAYGPLTTNNWVYAQIWSSNAFGSNGPYQTATVRVTALTRTTAFRVFNNNAYMNFIFGTASASGILQLWGASGASAGVGEGRGAYVRGTHNYATATHYRATIGAGGETGKITWVDYNGRGGYGGYSMYGGTNLHGGGRTAWQRWSGSAWVDVAIAGGGGSANGDGNTGARVAGGHAAGSGIGFQGGGGTQSTAASGQSGGGGSTTAGGQSANAAYNGALGIGGSTPDINAGGGGGGFYGGGGAVGDPNQGGGGGGGSSLTSGLTSVTTLNGNGSITTQTNYLAPAAVGGNDGLLVIDM